MVIQIYIVGSQASGKTSLVNKLLNDSFNENQPATIYPGAFHRHYFEVNDQRFKAQIHDMPAFDLHPGILQFPQYKQCKGFFIVFDLTSRHSFENAQRCWQQIKQNMKLSCQKAIILGNKKDLRQQIEVNRDQIDQFVLQQGLVFHAISAMTDSQETLKNLFTKRVQLLIGDLLLNQSISDAQKNIVLKTSQIQNDRKSNKTFWQGLKDCFGWL